ncbi:MAG: ferredoxin [Candidatus Levybacteria bacterium]|nr:ferredoxin [Candidatus Levybacteria bacterium]
MADKIVSYETENFTIKINRTQCISCGTCSAIAPDIFELDKDFICKVKENPTINKEDLINASNSCTTESITIIDKKTGKKIY